MLHDFLSHMCAPCMKSLRWISPTRARESLRPECTPVEPCDQKTQSNHTNSVTREKSVCWIVPGIFRYWSPSWDSLLIRFSTSTQFAPFTDCSTTTMAAQGATLQNCTDIGTQTTCWQMSPWEGRGTDSSIDLHVCNANQYASPRSFSF